MISIYRRGADQLISRPQGLMRLDTETRHDLGKEWLASLLDGLYASFPRLVWYSLFIRQFSLLHFSMAFWDTVLGSPPDAPPTYGRRLIPTIIDKNAATQPDHTCFSIPRSTNLKHEFRNISWRMVRKTSVSRHAVRGSGRLTITVRGRDQ